MQFYSAKRVTCFQISVLIREIPANGLRMRLTMDRETMDHRDQDLCYTDDADSFADLLRDGLLFRLAVVIVKLNKRLFGCRVYKCESSHNSDSDYPFGGYCGF